MQTSGLILDVYDDYRGDVIRSLFPSRSEIPGLVKTAHALSGDERGQLPDEVFALVLRNGDEVLRKFACIDAGNTALSVMFFQKNGHKLPEEAQKVAAANLKVACDWYELPVQGLEKVALAGWAANKAIQHPWSVLQAAMVGPDMVQEMRENSHAIHDIEKSRGGSLGGMPISSEQLKEYKHASMSPYVDVTNLEAKGAVTVKTASVYALGNRYPLDSYEQVKIASTYFGTHGHEFLPEDRRTFCKALVKRAEALNIFINDEVRHYGGEDFATPEMLKVAHDSRIGLLLDQGQRALLTALFEKAAELGPDLFAETLSEFDKIAGLNYLYDSDIADPFYSTFYKAAEQEYSYVEGNLVVTESSLRALAGSNRHLLKHTFGEDFVKEFCKDPVGIFKSMPKDQKKIIGRLAGDTDGPSNQPLT
jgi:hypothetical protein